MSSTNMCELCEENAAAIVISVTKLDGTLLDCERRCLECASEFVTPLGSLR